MSRSGARRRSRAAAARGTRALAAVAVLLAASCGGGEPERRDRAAVPRDGKVVFSSSRDGDFEIYAMSPDGTDVVQLTRNEETPRTEARDDSPSWSPDGSMVAFTSTRDHPMGGIETEELYVMNADGSGQRRLTEDDDRWTFAPWWPEDDLIAFTVCREGFRDCAVEAIAPDGSGRTTLRRLTDDVAWFAPSPDGSKILFSPRTWTEEGPSSESDIYLMEADGSGRRRLTSAAGHDDGAMWSPDGKQIAFLSERDRNGTCLWHDCVGHNPELYVMSADGSGERRLTDDPGEEGSLAWSPDGTRILFSAFRDGDDYELYVVNDDGTCLTQLTENREWDWAPDWHGEAGTGTGRLRC